jgi:hypothetical protein
MDFTDKVRSYNEAPSFGLALTLTLSQGERGPFGAG